MAGAYQDKEGDRSKTASTGAWRCMERVFDRLAMRERECVCVREGEREKAGWLPCGKRMQ